MPAASIRPTVIRLFRHGSFSLINIVGLSIGLSACLLIFLYVHYELSYDGYNVKAARIVRVTTLVHAPESDFHVAGTPYPLASALLRDCPDVEAAARIGSASLNLRLNGETVAGKDFYYPEPAIFTVFTFTFLEGSASTALSRPHSIVLTRSAATTCFGKAPSWERPSPPVVKPTASPP